MVKWPAVTVQTQDGPQPGVAPLVISASRSTDIPAFHAQWFAHRLAAGYCRWINPFSGRPQYVSFERTRAIVFWSKNPRPILPVLDLLDHRSIAYYFQYTLNDYEAEGLEPNVPALQERVETFQRFSRRLGKDRVIWRFDPLLLTDRLSEEALMRKVRHVGDMLCGLTDKMIISFADIGTYAKVRRNLGHHGVAYQEFDEPAMHRMAAGIARAAREWGMQAAACCEKVDLSGDGIERSHCIDPEVLLRISGNDPELLRCFWPKGRSEGGSPRTDPGQREECGCAVSKDIGQYNTCPHLCLYCYANVSQEVVRRNLQGAAAESESICRHDPR